jgi:hypothetical protein
VGNGERATGGLVVGVTGHRDIAEDDLNVRAAVREVLVRLGAPERTVTVLSCLAEGADRLVARVAVEELGAHLVAPLPLEPEEYENDFATDESRQEFRRLLRLADRCFVVRGGEWATEARSRGYACAGAWVVANCGVLLALWDGEPARGAGGTGELVEWVLSGTLPPRLEQCAGGPPSALRVIHVEPTTCRVSDLPRR